MVHALTWDYDDTRPEEEVNFERIFEMASDPQSVTRNLVSNVVIGGGIVSTFFDFLISRINLNFSS